VLRRANTLLPGHSIRPLYKSSSRAVAVAVALSIWLGAILEVFRRPALAGRCIVGTNGGEPEKLRAFMGISSAKKIARCPMDRFVGWGAVAVTLWGVQRF
jgi:hypothetical protein